MRVRPLLVIASSLLISVASVPAQVKASYVTYGLGCPGSSSTKLGCLTANWMQPFKGSIGTQAYFAVLMNSGSALRVITAFELFCATRTTQPVTMKVWIYDRAANGRPGTALRASTMKITSTPAITRATITPSLSVQPNTDFFLVMDNSVDLRLPVATQGTLYPHFWNGPSRWSGPSTSVAWMFNIICSNSSGPLPALVNNGLPIIARKFDIMLSQARANTAAVLLTGNPRTNIDLSHIGALGCTLLTLPLILLPTVTTASGGAKITLPLANDPSLASVKFQQQWIVIDPPANAAGMVFSNGGEGTIGY